jgi:hypothetical protein
MGFTSFVAGDVGQNSIKIWIVTGSYSTRKFTIVGKENDKK